MTATEHKLLALLKERSFTSGDFTLSSGDRSTYFIDGKMTEVSSAGAGLIGEVIFERTKDLDIDAIGGLEAGAIPLTTAAMISYGSRDRVMEGFWVRDKVKDHGTKKLIEGALKAGSRVVVVDDVLTRGTSALKAVKAVQEIGCAVVMVLAIVDRIKGAEALIREQGIDYQAVFSIREFGVEAADEVHCQSPVAVR